MAQVAVTREAFLVWLVWLDSRVVRTFANGLEALDYASLLECNPRIRAEATAAVEAQPA